MSKILENWENGLGLPGVLVIDGHTHICPWRWPFLYFNLETVETTAESVAMFMNANGVDAACSMPTGYYLPGGNYRLGNDFLLGVWRKMPDRLIPFLCVNPNDTRENIIAELDRMYDAGMRCIKLINSYQENYPGDGRNLMAVYEYAAKHKMLILNHAWGEALMSISAEFPDVDFICGHYNASQDPILKERDNVYANIWGYGNCGWLDRGIRNIGAGKLLFGSDAFLNPPSVGVGPVVYAPISDEEKRLILGLNQARLLDKVGALPAEIRKKHGIF